MIYEKGKKKMNVSNIKVGHRYRLYDGEHEGLADVTRIHNGDTYYETPIYKNSGCISTHEFIDLVVEDLGEAARGNYEDRTGSTF